MAQVNDEIHLSEEDLSGNMSGLEDEEASEDSFIEKGQFEWNWKYVCIALHLRQGNSRILEEFN